MTPDLKLLASEAVELAKRATPGPWRPCQASSARCVCGLVWSTPADVAVLAVQVSTCTFQDHGDCSPPTDEAVANQHLIAHAGTHYATLAAGYLAAVEENGKMRAALERCVRFYRTDKDRLPFAIENAAAALGAEGAPR